MKKKNDSVHIPDLTEFTDEAGSRWIQTSTEDLFTISELNEVLKKIDSDRDQGEMVLARIDFQKVNREYYDAALALQKKLNRQNETLKKMIQDAQQTIERKNRKLKELIAYIKKLHQLLAWINSNPEEADTMDLSNLRVTTSSQEDEYVPEYVDVEEILLTPEGEESGPVPSR